MREISIDCFCGGGGASLGYEMATGMQISIAINHDINAILMHQENHPATMHLKEDIFHTDLRKHLRSGDIVRFMWASPDCTSHSKAKGGQPRLSGLRILPWAVHRLCKQILEATGKLPECLIMENVEEIQRWGPLDEKGYPIKERAGEDYQNFIKSMKSLGFRFDCRELVAADYGAPTTRKRWYAIFRSDSISISWPVPTHNRYGTDGLNKWVPVSTCLDFTNFGKSIFDRKKELAENTQRRIANGIKKFIIDNPNPFMVPKEDAMSFLIQYHSETKNSEVRGQTLDEPIKTLDTSNRYGLVTAFITKFYKTGIGQGCDEPLHTITTSPGHFGLVSAFLVKYYGGEKDGQGVDVPLGTIVTKDRFGLVNVVFDIKGEMYLIKDIFLRMLKPEECKLAQSFTKDYIIDRDYLGRPYPVKEQMARIGNSVVPVVACALINANCPYLRKHKRVTNMSIDDSKEQLSFAM